MKKAILVGILFIGLIWFFWSGISINFFASATIFIAICAAVAVGVVGFWFVASLYNFRDEKEAEKPVLPLENPENATTKEPDNSWVAFVGMIVFAVVIFPIMLIYHESTMEDDEIKQFGEFTTGMVVDGSSYKTRKADFTSVTIKFRTKDGKEYTAEHDISAGEFSNMYQYQEIPLMYSTRYPSILKFLRSDEDISKYSKKTVRDLNLQDLLKVLDLENAEKINVFLNTVNEKWDYKNEDAKSVVFYNNMRGVGLKVTGKNELAYMSEKFKIPQFIDELKKAGFKSMEASQPYYAKDKYIVKVSNQQVASHDDNGMIADFKSVTVVNILKAE